MKHRNKWLIKLKRGKRSSFACYECPWREENKTKTVFVKIMAENGWILSHRTG